MEQVSPTRTELLTRRSQIQLARQGAELLKGKREALVREFITELRRFTAEREALRSSLDAAGQSLMRALSVDGPEALASVALAQRWGVELELQERNIWGVRVTDVQSDYRARPAGGHRYTAIGASVRIEDATERFEAALERLIKIAPLDRKMRRLADEIRKTTRRVNALEQRLLPALQEQVKYIRSVLDQREREDTFRLKRLKKKRSRSGAGGGS
jgi:V/A-type H+-transporting ATPase subunit D